MNVEDEDQGLLTSDRSPSGQRLYTEEHVERVRPVRALLAAGLSSHTIAEMVPCCARGVPRPGDPGAGARTSAGRDDCPR